METTKKTSKTETVETTAKESITETTTVETPVVETRKASTISEKIKEVQKPAVAASTSGELTAKQKRNMSHQAIRQYYLNLSK
jgi:cell fate (sporulation/competence/biofilm development) regulator YmcA (YheA/YmcA/DUF963 family)